MSSSVKTNTAQNDVEPGRENTQASAYSVGALRGLLLLLALAYLVEFVIMACFRLRYPFELEWLEGSIVDYIQRIMAGQSIYVSPSIDFTCYQYPPLYYLVSAGACYLFGVGFFALRTVSFLATLGAFAIIAYLVKRETKTWFWGVIAAGLYAGTFQAAGGWFDLARVDSLFLFFLLAAICAARFMQRRTLYAAATACLFLLAFFTKQSALFPAAAIITYTALVDWRRALVLGGIFTIAAAILIARLDYANDGWYFYYTFRLLGQHAILKDKWIGFWTHDLMPALPIAFIAAILFFGVVVRTLDRSKAFYLFIGAGAILASWTARLHEGSFENALMPAFAILAIVFTLALHQAIAKTTERRPRYPRAIIIALYALCITQMLVLEYDPRKQIPTQSDRQAGYKFIELLRSFDGAIYVPYSGFYPTLAGKHSYAHVQTIRDILRAKDDTLKKELLLELDRAFREKRFTALILPDLEDARAFRMLAERYYRKLPNPIFTDPTVFWPPNGVKVRPNAIYVPKTQSPY